MSNPVAVTKRPYATIGAPRVRDMFRPSTAWSICAPANPKTSDHVATRDFGGNATTLHPRPEEIPL